MCCLNTKKEEQKETIHADTVDQCLKVRCEEVKCFNCEALCEVWRVRFPSAPGFSSNSKRRQHECIAYVCM